MFYVPTTLYTLMLWVNANIEVVGYVILVCYLTLVDSRGYVIISDIHVIKANCLIVPVYIQCLSAVVHLCIDLRSSWCVPDSILVRFCCTTCSTICCTKQCSIIFAKLIQHDQGVVHQPF